VRVELAGHQRLPEPQLAFHPQRQSDLSPHPLKGLLEFGPYSQSLMNPIIDPIRVATLAPHGEGATLKRFLDELEAAHQPSERRQYLPAWPGFSKVFGLRLVPAEASTAHIQLPGDLDSRLDAASQPHVVLADELTKALRAFGSAGSDYDLVMILLPDRWNEGFYGPDGDDFDLHAFLKAVLAMKGLPSQIVRETSALTYFCRCSVAWRMGVAAYCKAGGVPWKLAEADEEVAFIGLSYALKPGAPEGQRFLTCCSQVFDADGAGLEFIAYETPDYRMYGENPFLSRAEMRRVMSRSLDLYLQRHNGRPPRRVTIHKTTEFKPREIDGVYDALGHIAEVDLVQIKRHSGWRGFRVDPPRSGRRGSPAGYPLERGSLLPIGGTEALLWTAGDAPEVASKRHYFKEGKGTPSPLMLVRHGGHGGWEDGASAVLGLSKMNWNNDALYDRLPVTLGFAQELAKSVGHMPTLGARPYPVRYFM
jgi:hypothetical protein